MREIEYGSADYLAEVALRNEILREPLGLALTPAELNLDRGDVHLGAFTEQGLVGCAIIKRIDADVVRMRQVAVRVPGKGIGRLLSERAETVAREMGAAKIVLEGRESALGFYVRLGYKIESGPHSKNTGQHFHMSKDLTAE